MALLGPQGQCSIEEYNRRRAERIKESGLNGEEIYSFYSRFDDKRIEALSLVAQAEVIRKMGTTIVNLTMLDDDFQPLHHNRGQMIDGIWTASEDDLFGIIMPDNRAIMHLEGFMVDYDGDLGLPSIETVIEDFLVNT